MLLLRPISDPNIKRKNMSQVKGKIIQIIGPVVDVRFENSKDIPNILDALEVTNPQGHIIVMECQQHVGEDTIRAISMDATDGLQRGMPVTATGQPITMPVGEQVKGRLFNVVGETIDGIGTVDREGAKSIH